MLVLTAMIATVSTSRPGHRSPGGRRATHIAPTIQASAAIIAAATLKSTRVVAKRTAGAISSGREAHGHARDDVADVRAGPVLGQDRSQSGFLECRHAFGPSPATRPDDRRTPKTTEQRLFVRKSSAPSSLRADPARRSRARQDRTAGHAAGPRTFVHLVRTGRRRSVRGSDSDQGQDVMGHVPLGSARARRTGDARAGLAYGIGLLMSVLVLGALSLLPAPAMAAGTIGALSINPDSVRDGQSTTGTVELPFADPQPTVVRLFSERPGGGAGAGLDHHPGRPDHRHVHHHLQRSGAAGERARSPAPPRTTARGPTSCR